MIGPNGGGGDGGSYWARQDCVWRMETFMD